MNSKLSEARPSILREDVPLLRTADALIHKHEQIQDGLERQAITGKQAEQMNQTLKGIMAISRLEMQYFSLMLKFKRHPPVPRSALLRNVIGLPEKVSNTDAKQLQDATGQQD